MHVLLKKGHSADGAHQKLKTKAFRVILHNCRKQMSCLRLFAGTRHARHYEALPGMS